MSLTVKKMVGVVAGALAFCGGVAASPLESAVSKAVLTNPEVLDQWHRFQASVHERQISWGRYLPTLDVMFGTGYERRETPLYTAPTGKRDYNFQLGRATLRQNLFEGFATENDEKRLEHASMVRFFEMLDASEQVAYEATKAVYDLWRYRQLVSFAEDNYATHRVVYEKIKQRAMSGTSRKVDLETAAGRLALAESNLVTETSNLHDVSARYQRIIGALPPVEVDALPGMLFSKRMPVDHAEALRLSFEKSPRLKAALENIYSAARQVEVKKSGAYPCVDAYVEQRHESNTGGYLGTTTATTFGLTATWNLFNGLQDVSQMRKAAEEKNAAKDVREKVCREVRQNSVMSFNDQKRLTAQLQFLDQHQLSTDKTREAFRRQFEIGQRTLLDLLDTENEYYTARRNYLNGEVDLSIAQARYLAASGTLLAALGVQHLDALPFNPEPSSDDALEQPCPPEVQTQVKPAAPSLRSDYVVLLESPDGTVGKVHISGGRGDQLVEQPYFAVPLDGAKAAEAISEETVRQDFADTMAARPTVPEHFVLRFESGSARLTAESTEQLPLLVEAVRKFNVAEIEIVGHTDTVGSTKLNDALGLKRAQFVAGKIRSYGLKVLSLTAESHGERDLLVKTPDNTREPKNRRVSVSVR